MSLKDKLHVMVVDDMSISRALIIQALEELGIDNTDFCKNGAEGFRKIIARPVHIVISDYHMPSMNGLELLQALRNHPNTQKIIFILVTGSPTQEILSIGRRLGMNNYIKKPFTTAAMKNCLESVVGRL